MIAVKTINRWLYFYLINLVVVVSLLPHLPGRTLHYHCKHTKKMLELSAESISDRISFQAVADLHRE